MRFFIIGVDGDSNIFRNRCSSPDVVAGMDG